MRRLVFKLAFAFVVASWVVLSIHGYFSVQRDRTRFQAEVQRTLRLVAHILAPTVAEVWAERGEEAALGVIERANQREDGVRIRWVWVDAPPGDKFAPDSGSVPLLGLHEGDDILHVARHPGGATRIYTYVHVDTPSVRLGAIELVESNREQHRYVETTIASAILVNVILAATNGLIAIIFGAWLVGRPVLALVGKTRRIAAGDLEGPLRLQRRDELGDIANEIDLMCEKLATAQARTAAETAEKIRTLEELRHADRLTTVGKLAAGIAHELGTPLSVVAGRARMILRAKDPARVNEHAEIVIAEAERMTTIIGQVLDLARKGAAQKSRVDLGSLANDVIALLDPIAAKAGVGLARVGDGEHVVASADRAQIQQVLTNLVVNAIQATKGRGTRVEVGVARVDREPPEGEPSEARRFTTITVRDDGPGIPADVLPQIFEPFFTTNDVGEGTGLGLSVSQGIVRDHGGFIEVANAEPAGATFTVYLPESDANEEPVSGTNNA